MEGKCIVFVFVSWNRRENDKNFAKFYKNQPNKLNLAHLSVDAFCSKSS